MSSYETPGGGELIWKGGGVGAMTELLKEPTFILLLLLVNAMEGVI